MERYCTITDFKVNVIDWVKAKQLSSFCDNKVFRSLFKILIQSLLFSKSHMYIVSRVK